MLTIENEENLVGSLIRKDFEREVDHIEKMFELFMKSYSFICKHEDDLLSKEDCKMVYLFSIHPKSSDFAKCLSFYVKRLL